MNELEFAWGIFERNLKDDPEYLWAFHCNVAMPIFDSVEISHKDANIAAARIMAHLFNVDVTDNENYKSIMRQFNDLEGM